MSDAITAGSWTPPLARRANWLTTPVTVGYYAPRWLAGRKVKGRPLAERTRDHYQDLLDRFILPTFADIALEDVTPEAVAEWYDTAADTPTYQAHAYSLLRAIMRTAADPTKNSGAALIPFNPCGISGGGSSGTKRRIRPATAQASRSMAYRSAIRSPCRSASLRAIGQRTEVTVLRSGALVDAVVLPIELVD